MLSSPALAVDLLNTSMLSELPMYNSVTSVPNKWCRCQVFCLIRMVHILDRASAV